MRIIYLFIFFTGVIGTQDFKLNLNKKPESGDEKRYPNGTVIGKYTYMDDSGNPIEVKYYADDTGYGVELRSIKLLDVSPKMPIEQDDKLEFFTKTEQTPVKTGSDFANFNYPLILKDNDLFGYLNKGNNKMDKPKSDKASSDYETYYKNELRGPKKWTNDKVRVYLDKEKAKRRVRNSFKKTKYQN